MRLFRKRNRYVEQGKDFENQLTDYFNWKLADKIKDLIVKKINQSQREYEACEVCGCMVHPMSVVTGEGEIKKRRKFNGYMPAGYEDYIYYPKYCKVHAPKQETEDEDTAKED